VGACVAAAAANGNDEARGAVRAALRRRKTAIMNRSLKSR
jgi:hypothetical protein